MGVCRMRALCSLGLILAMTGQAVAQDTSVVIRGNSRDGAGSADTTITISRPGQPDQVIRVTGRLSRALRANLERQVQESQKAMANLRESARDMHGRQRDLVGRSGELTRSLGDLMIARQSSDLGGRSMQVFAARPRIGVTVDIRARESDRYGAYVTAVTPGGPAAKAGIHAGDIITRIGGKSLTAPDSIRHDIGESAPGMRLFQLVARLEAGKSVEFELRRGDDSRKVSVVPADYDMFAYSGDAASGVYSLSPSGGAAGRVMITPRSGAMIGEVPIESRFFETFARGTAGERVALVSAFGGPLADLELAPLNEKLGSYFGVTEGVLVIDVPAKDNLGLIPGDVITAIDGRKVGTPSQLFRVLGTYDKGEELKFQVTRQRRSETVVSKVP